MGWRLACALGGLAVLAALRASPAHAQSPRRVQLRFDGGGCGSAAELQARISLRASQLRFVDSAPQGFLQVGVEENPAGFGAQLLFEAGGSRVERRIEATTCEDALDALALIAAVSLADWEPPAPRKPSRAPRPAVVAPPAAPPPEPPPAEASGPASTEPSPEPHLEQPTTSEPLPRGPSPEATALVETESAVPSERLAWTVVAGARLLSGVSRGVMPGARVDLRVAFGRRWRLSWFRPELSITAAYYWRDGAPTRGPERLDMTLASLGAEACPLRAALGSVALLPCLYFDAGRLYARGRGTFAPEEHTRGLRTAGLSLGGRWRRGAFEVGASARVARAGPTHAFTFSEQSVSVQPPAHQLDAWIWGAGVSLGWAVP